MYDGPLRLLENTTPILCSVSPVQIGVIKFTVNITICPHTEHTHVSNTSLPNPGAVSKSVGGPGRRLALQLVATSGLRVVTFFPADPSVLGYTS